MPIPLSLPFLGILENYDGLRVIGVLFCSFWATVEKHSGATRQTRWKKIVFLCRCERLILTI